MSKRCVVSIQCTSACFWRLKGGNFKKFETNINKTESIHSMTARWIENCIQIWSNCNCKFFNVLRDFYLIPFDKSDQYWTFPVNTDQRNCIMLWNHAKIIQSGGKDHRVTSRTCETHLAVKKGMKGLVPLFLLFFINMFFLRALSYSICLSIFHNP